MVTATETRPDDHGPHAKGVSAILRTENSPFDLLNGALKFQMANSLLAKGPLKVGITYSWSSAIAERI